MKSSIDVVVVVDDSDDNIPLTAHDKKKTRIDSGLTLKANSTKAVGSREINRWKRWTGPAGTPLLLE